MTMMMTEMMIVRAVQYFRAKSFSEAEGTSQMERQSST